VTFPAKPEFSRLLTVEGLDDEGRTFRVEAEQGEREALARRFGLVSLDRLAAEGAIFPEANSGLFRLQARVIADVVQSCVVTLAPVASRLDVAFERLYGPDVENEWTDKDDSGRELFLSPEEDLLPEPLLGESVDVGEAVAEQLALELTPFPRAVGAVFEGLPGGSQEVSEGAKANGPFAALAELRWKRSNQA
jgi:uncharacterized metal-binding protein YceD (DUF177 family)